MRYRGLGLAVVVRLVAAGHGLALLPQGLALDHPGVRRVLLRVPDVVHRVELVSVPARTADLATLFAGS